MDKLLIFLALMVMKNFTNYRQIEFAIDHKQRKDEGFQSRENGSDQTEM